MAKGKLFIAILAVFLILSMGFASADLYVREEIDKSYTTDVQRITYAEDLKGREKGFSLTITSTSPKYSYKYEDDYPYITWGYIQPRYGYSGYEPSYKYYDRVRDYRDYLEPALYTYRLGRDRKRYTYRYSYRNYGYGYYLGYQRNSWGYY